MKEKQKQKIRLKRFTMALITYVVVILAAYFITQLGLGKMSLGQWTFFIAFALFGNTLFFTLFHTNINLRFSDPSLTREQIIYSALWGMVPLYALPEARPIVLMFYLPAFSFGMLRLRLKQYLSAVLAVMGLYAVLLLLEYIGDRANFRMEYEIFLFVLFGILLLWFAFFGGFISNLRNRMRIQNSEIQKTNNEIKIEIKERKKAQEEKDQLILQLKDALAKVNVLSGMLPICSICKNIRDDTGYWNRLEAFIGRHSDVEFSHSICPDCAKRHYPDVKFTKNNIGDEQNKKN